jgi:hypothetical protein
LSRIGLIVDSDCNAFLSLNDNTRQLKIWDICAGLEVLTMPSLCAENDFGFSPSLEQ